MEEFLSFTNNQKNNVFRKNNDCFLKHQQRSEKSKTNINEAQHTHTYELFVTSHQTTHSVPKQQIDNTDTSHWILKKAIPPTN